MFASSISEALQRIMTVLIVMGCSTIGRDLVMVAHTCSLSHKQLRVSNLVM